jgi:hypothetical protein
VPRLLLEGAALGRSTMTIDDGAAHDPDVIALRAKVTVNSDGQNGAPTDIEVDTTDGRRLRAAHDVNTPSADLVDQRQRVLDKYRIVAAAALTPEQVEAVIAAVETLPTATDLTELIAACTRAR